MNQAIVAIVGVDRPGIVHKVSLALAQKGCRLLSVSQTTLLGQFAGLFATLVPSAVSLDDLSAALSASLEGSRLSWWIAPPPDGGQSHKVASEPYVLTILGPDGPQVIPEVTKTVASFEANIENLRAVTIGSAGRAAADGQPLALVLEITVPVSVQKSAFRQALALTAEEQGIEISLQHRNIFEAIHRV
jgi:glycine cleavage system transcriptional repressor